MKFDDGEEEWIISSSVEEKILTLTAEYEPKGGEKEKSEVVDHRVSFFCRLCWACYLILTTLFVQVARRNFIVDIVSLSEPVLLFHSTRNYQLFCEDGGNGSPTDIDFTDAVVNVRQEIFFWVFVFCENYVHP